MARLAFAGLSRAGQALRRTAMLLAALLAVAAPGQAGVPPCGGRDLIAEAPAARRAELQARVAAVPYARGILWQARRGDARLILAGTYHFTDPRHAAVAGRLRPAIAHAATLLVEAGPAEERALERALRADPTLMTDPDGPGLDRRLSPRDWQRLSAAMAARGVPPKVSVRLRPWYLATMLGVSPCMLRQAAAAEEGGLDHRLIAAAEAAGTPVRALEPWDTVFQVFAGLTPADQLDMLRAALPEAERADDYARTMTEAYFAGDIWQLWEFGRLDAYDHSGLTRAEVDALTDLTRRQLMDNRNVAWIGPLTEAAEDAAKDGKPVVAAFGALHLPGESGVLRLLQKDGWSVTPWTGDEPR